MTPPRACEDDTALLVQVESSTVVSMKMNTVWQVQVIGSTVDLYLDVAGAYSKWALDISGAQYGLGLAIGLGLGLDGVFSN